MWGAIAGAAASAIGGTIGAIRASKQAKKATKMVEKQKADNDRWYQQESNTNFLDTAASKATLAQLREEGKRQQQAATNSLSKAGATAEERIAAASGINQNYASAASRLAGLGTQYQQQVRARYDNKNDNYTSQLANIAAGKASTAAQIGDSVTGVIQGLDTAGLLDFGRKSNSSLNIPKAL